MRTRQLIVTLLLLTLAVAPGMCATTLAHYSGSVRKTTGAVAAGLTVHVYLTGTTTAASLYSDYAGTTPKANPTTTDSSGEYSFYVVEGRYDIKVSGTGVATKTYADVQINAPPTKVPFGWVDSHSYVIGDGTDETTDFQAMLNAAQNGTLYLRRPESVYVIQQVSLPSNVTVVTEPGTVIRADDDITAAQGVFLLQHVSGVRFTGGPLIIEGGSVHGENPAGYGIRCYAASDCSFEHVTCRYFTDDGFYVAGHGTNPAADSFSEQVTFRGCVATYNDRNGFTLVSGKGVVFEDCQSTFNRGDSAGPAAGWDIEPEAATDLLQNVRLTNCYTEGNNGLDGSPSASTGRGIALSLQDLAGSDYPVSIEIVGHRDYNSYIGMTVRGGNGTLHGQVLVDSPVWELNEKSGLMVQEWDKDFPRLVVRHPVVLDPNDMAAADSGGKYGSGIVIFRDEDSAQRHVMGNILLERPEIRDTRVSPKIEHGIHVQDHTVGTRTIGAVGTPGASRTANVTTITTTSGHGFAVGDTVYVWGVTPVGATTFDGGPFTILATPTTASFTYADVAADDTGGGGSCAVVRIQDVDIRDPVSLEGVAANSHELNFTGAGSIEDAYSQLDWALADGNSTVNGTTLCRTFNNSLHTATRTITLAKFVPGAPDITFRVDAPQYLRIDPDPTDRIRGMGAPGAYIESNEVGAFITLRKADASSWQVVEKGGAWDMQAVALSNADQTLTGVNYDREFSNSAYTGGHALTLPACVAGQGDITIRIDVAQTVTITRAGSDTIIPGAATTYASSTVGSKVRLRPTSLGWRIIEQIGTWS